MQDEPSVSASSADTRVSPEMFIIPSQLIEQWLRIPANHYVEARLTRRDIDLLLFGLLKAFRSQELLSRVMVDLSNGSVPQANANLADARIAMVEGQNDVRQFFSALMISALGARDHEG